MLQKLRMDRYGVPDLLMASFANAPRQHGSIGEVELRVRGGEHEKRHECSSARKNRSLVVASLGRRASGIFKSTADGWLIARPPGLRHVSQRSLRRTIFVFTCTGWRWAATAYRYGPKEQSERAVVAALAPVCADKFRALPDAEAKTIALSKVEAWKRGEEFPKEIVTLPGETSPNYALVYACSTLLLAPKSAALQ